jgi:dolichol-phosphate mannosyltransferase
LTKEVIEHQEGISSSLKNSNTGSLADLVTILVPTLNEVENVDHLVERILAATKDAGFSIEIVFVDGGSTDGTQEAVRAWENKGPVRLAQSDGKGGLSGDILYGAAAVQTDVVVVMDADLSHPPEALPALIRPILAGTQDMAIGSRYVPGGQTPGWPWTRRITSKVATILAWPLVSIRDPMSGFFAVRRERLLSLGKEATGFKIALEIVARGDDSLRVLEVPITFIDRERGTSKFGATEIISCIKQMLLLAGGAVSTGSAARFAVVGSLGVIIDYLIFNLLLSAGAGIVPSHLLSFIAATIFNYFLNARWTFASTASLNSIPQWKLYLSFLSVCILALLFRGAILAVLTESAGWSPRIAILFAIAAAAMVNFAGSAFFVFPQHYTRATPAVRWRVFAICVVLYAVLIRLAFMGIIDLIPEEAYYWNYAQRLDFGYLDHPPMVAWLIWLGTSVAGTNETGVRLLAMPSWFIVAFFMYGLTKNLFGKTAAFITLMFLATFPVYFLTGFFMAPDTPLYAAWAGCLYFLERALLAGDRRAWMWAGICLGLGMLSKYTIILLAPASFLFLVIDKEARRWLKRQEPYVAFAMACVIFSPVILWNATHGWASFVFQGVERWSSSTQISPHVFVASVLLLLTPIGLIGALGVMIRRWAAPLIMQEGSSPNRKRFFTILFTLVPLSVFFCSSLYKAPRLHWTGPVWLSILPLIASAIVVSTRSAATGWFVRFNARLWKPTAVCLLLMYGGFMYYVLIGTPGLSHLLGMKRVPVAWEEMGAEFGALEKQIESETGKKPLIVGMDLYPLSAELSFYLPDPDAAKRVSGRHLFGRRSLMWKYWHPASGAYGKTVIAVDYRADSLSDDKLAKYFERLGPIGYRDIRKNGQLSGRLYYRVGYDYRDGT